MTFEQIVAATCAHFGVPVREMEGDSRRRCIARPRQVIMYLAKQHTQLSFESIGYLLGGRDHTTILHGVRQIERLKKSDLAIAESVLTIKEKLSPKYDTCPPFQLCRSLDVPAEYERIAA